MTYWAYRLVLGSLDALLPSSLSHHFIEFGSTTGREPCESWNRTRISRVAPEGNLVRIWEERDHLEQFERV